MRRALPILFVLGFLRPLHAEDPDETLYVRAPDVVRVEAYSDADQGSAYVLIGNIRFGRPGLYSVEAERMVVWVDPRAEENLFTVLRSLKERDGVIPIWAVRAIYAEGAGRAPLTFQAAGQFLRAHSLYYDFVRHEGLFADAELRVRRDPGAATGDPLPDLVFRAKTFRARGPGRWSARDVSLFSSDYVEPEVELRIRELELDNGPVRRATGRLLLLSARGAATLGGPTAGELRAVEEVFADAASTQDATHGSLHGVQARGFGLPVFGWRRVDLDGADLDELVVRVQAGQIGSMGRGGYLALGRRSKPFGWVLGGGYVDDHGPLLDTELSLDAWDGLVRGRTIGAWFHDRGTDFNGFVPPSEDRYWFQNRYRFRLDDAWRFDLEYTGLSDAHFLRIYDEREAKEGKAQENLGYLRWKGERAYATFLYQWQVEDFLEVTEQLPAAGFAVPTLTLLRLGRDGSGRPILLQLAMETELANLRYRSGDPATGDFRTPRYDLAPTLYAAFQAGPVRVTPFATFEYTWYDETLDGSTANRVAQTAGVRADLRLYRWFGDLQHIVNLSVTYQDLYSVDVAASELFDFDETDEITPYEGLTVRMRNRFLTRSPRGRREFLNFELAGTWYPDGDAPYGATSDGIVELDSEWYPAPGWLVEVRGEYLPSAGTLETGSVVGRWGANTDVSFWGGLRHLEADSDVITGGGEFVLQNRWRLVALSQYDLKNEEALDQAVILQRMTETFLLGFRVKYKPGEDRVTFSLKFDLLEHFRSERRKRAEEELRREIRYAPRNGG